MFIIFHVLFQICCKFTQVLTANIIHVLTLSSWICMRGWDCGQGKGNTHQRSNWQGRKLAETHSFDKNADLKVPLHIVILKIIINCNRDTMLKRFPCFYLQNSANFDQTISVGQVVPEITPPPQPISFSHWIRADLIDHSDEPWNGGISPIGGGIGTLLMGPTCIHTIVLQNLRAFLPLILVCPTEQPTLPRFSSLLHVPMEPLWI